LTTEALYKELNYVNHSREKRLFYANLMINNPHLIPKLLEILFMVNDKISPRAAWVLEFTIGKNLTTIIPHLDYFIENMHKVHLDSAVRPVAKICEYLILAYYGGDSPKIKAHLLPKHLEKITETCFDWMINDEKVAPKAYSMNCLYLLGRDYDWIHPELITILQRDYHSQSAAFKARSRHIFKKLKIN